MNSLIELKLIIYFQKNLKMLYICATPIGNLADITFRALEVLGGSDIILCEDTRLSKHLLHHYGIKYKELVALHDHNENEVSEKVLLWLQSGLTVTLISDAGTPGVSDPGSRLCQKVLGCGLKLSPIPGASAYISLLSVSGLDISSMFYGFLPSGHSARVRVLETWQSVAYAVCVYEAPHRIVESITDIITVLGSEREIIMGRELTKQFETIKRCKASELLEFIESDSNQTRGEFALIIVPEAKKTDSTESLTPEQISTLKLLLPELPPKRAVQLTHKICGGNKDLLYEYSLKIKK